MPNMTDARQSQPVTMWTTQVQANVDGSHRSPRDGEISFDLPNREIFLSSQGGGRSQTSLTGSGLRKSSKDKF